MSQQYRRNILFGFLLTLSFGSTLSDDMEVVSEQPFVLRSLDCVATSIVSTFAPGDEGSAPRHHSGPVVGYVLEGSFLFQVANEPPRVIPAGGTFYENDGVTRVWGANASDNSTCRVFYTIYGQPGEAIIAYGFQEMLLPRKSRVEALAEAAAASLV